MIVCHIVHYVEYVTVMRKTKNNLKMTKIQLGLLLF